MSSITKSLSRWADRPLLSLPAIVLLAGLLSCADDSKVDFTQCELLAFEQSIGMASVSEQSILLKSQDVDEAGTNSILFESWVVADGPSEPGTFKLYPSVNYKSCTTCLTLETGCADGTCEKVYIATAGNITLQSVSQVEGEPVGIRLNEVMFEEVTIAEDYTSTLVEGAQAYCMKNVGVSGLVGRNDNPNSQEVEADTPDPGCLAAGSGKGLGDNIKDFSLTNCLGESVSFHEFCGAYKAIWMVTTAGWCGACESWLPQVQEEYEGLAERGLGLLVYLGSDINYSTPTQAYCASYAERKGLDPARVFIDGNWQGLFGAVDRYDYNFTPMNIVVDGSNLSYVWSDGANDGDTTTLNGALEGLLD